jgi:two-component system, NarL family, response regulator DevR
MSVGKRIELMIVDRDDFTRAGMRALFHGEEDMRVVGEATSSDEAVRQAARLAPDVVIVDGSLADGGGGLEVCRQVRAYSPGSRVLVVIDQVNSLSVLTAIRAGADGCVSKRSRLEELCRIVRLLAAGEAVLDPRTTRVLLAYLRRQPGRTPDGDAALTDVERRVLTLVAAGKTNKEIGLDLALSVKTVKNRLGHAFSKLHVTRRAEAAVLFAVPGASPGDDPPGRRES